MATSERDVERLRKVPILTGLPTGQLKLIAYLADVLHFEPGEPILQPGGVAETVDILLDGEAEVWLPGPDGRETRLATLGRHSLVGETAVLCQTRRTTTVRAKGHVATLRLSASTFLGLVRQSAELATRVLANLARQLEHTTLLLQQPTTPLSQPLSRRELAGALVAGSPGRVGHGSFPNEGADAG